MYAQVSAFFGPIIGEVCARLWGRQSTFYCSALLSALTMLLIFRTEETLRPEVIAHRCCQQNPGGA